MAADKRCASVAISCLGLFCLISCATRKSIENAEYAVAFEVPASFRVESASLRSKNPEKADSGVLIDHYRYGFSDAGYATISKLQDYREGGAKETLESLYNDKRVRKSDIVYLPSRYRDGGYDCALMAFSDPQYVESENGEFKGMRYYAQIAQDDYPCLNCVLVLTDGDAVFEYVSRRYISSKYASQIKKGRIEGFVQQEYSDYLKTIKDDAEEAVVRDYVKELHLIGRSLRRLR